ncbi:hypothetical protein O181_070875 [Austropuccinia psidii MF-1]|uniref:Transmembrane protein n=1 Tax=Austropuccinia psidii MF-1 TaxID=1389203 RepID=A0A9Q3I9I0_9BASI|nr:hypothetical protein [Austropuccinia psidii MF-1]
MAGAPPVIGAPHQDKKPPVSQCRLTPSGRQSVLSLRPQATPNMKIIIYSIILIISIVNLFFSIYTFRTPNWIRFDSPKSSPFQLTSIFGLKEKCDKSADYSQFQCRKFPEKSKDCSIDINLFKTNQLTLQPALKLLKNRGDESLGDQDQVNQFNAHTHQTKSGFGFCEKWNTAAYTSQLSIIINLISVFCIFIVLIGNNYRKENGWKVCGGLILIHAIFQTISWSLIIKVFNEDDRFYLGSNLSLSTYISILTSILDLMCFTTLICGEFSGVFKHSNQAEEDDDYVPIN